MSDLSNVLGDLFGGNDAGRDPTPITTPSAPEPVAPVLHAVPAPAAQEDDDLLSALDDALAALPTETEAPEPVTPIVAAEDWAEKLDSDPGRLHQRGALRAWTPADDDFLPSKGKRKKKGK